MTWRLGLGACLVAVAGAATGALAGASAPPPNPRQTQARLSDAQAATLAKGALESQDPTSIRAVLAQLKKHSFKSSKVPERELVLYAQGVLEARLGNLAGAAVALKKLEKQWPHSPFMGEAQAILAQDAMAQKRYKDAERRLHQALASDMPSERKRQPQELLIWALVEQGRPQEALPIVQALRPLEPKERPTEQGLAGIVEVLATAGNKQQAEGSRKDFQNLYPKSALAPRVELAWGRLLGSSGDAKGSAQVFRQIIKDFPKTSQADDARLALASLLTDGSLPDAKGMPSAEALLAEVRKGGKGLPKGAAQLVELRLLVEKKAWEEALNGVDRMDAAMKLGQGEVNQLWRQAWRAWVGERVEKNFAGELLGRMKPGAFGALEPATRLAVAELFAAKGLLEVLPPLLLEVPRAERVTLSRAAMGKVEPESQPAGVLKLLPNRGGTADEVLLRIRAEAALGHWPAVRGSLDHARPGAGRLGVLQRYLERPLEARETSGQRLIEAEKWLRRAPEKRDALEPIIILVADLRMRGGDPKGALALYPQHSTDPLQRGWVALMRSQAMLKLGQRAEATRTLREARDEQGFKGQRDAFAKSLGAY
jgi:TolA-binding protein